MGCDAVTGQLVPGVRKDCTAFIFKGRAVKDSSSLKCQELFSKLAISRHCITSQRVKMSFTKGQKPAIGHNDPFLGVK